MALFGFLKRPKSESPEPRPRPAARPGHAAAGRAVFAPARVLEPAPSTAVNAPAPTPDSTTATDEPAPSEHRRRLFDAVSAGDEQRLADLCQRHWDLLLRHAPEWMQADVPAPLRNNPEAADWFGQGLRAIARFCAERLERPELMHRLGVVEVSGVDVSRVDAARRDAGENGNSLVEPNMPHPGQDAPRDLVRDDPPCPADLTANVFERAGQPGQHA